MLVKRAIANTYLGMTRDGRNNPLKLIIEDEDGLKHFSYLKPSGRREIGIHGMVAELLGVLLANDVGIPVNQAFLVEWDDAFIRSLDDPGVRELLLASCPVAFASKDAGSQWRIWGPGDLVTQARQSIALQILAFDVMIENPDRRRSNPNLLICGDDVRPIDHELAFRFNLPLLGQKPHPWQTGNCHRHVQVGTGHVFGAPLVGRALDFAPLERAWSGLSALTFMRYPMCLPAEWSEGHDTLNAAISHLTEVAQRFHECIEELKRALT